MIVVIIKCNLSTHQMNDVIYKGTHPLERVEHVDRSKLADI